MVQFWIKDSKFLTLFCRRKIFGIKIQILFWILNHCELHPRFFFAIMPIFFNHYQALKSHEEEHFFWVRKKALLVILLLRPIYGGTLCILNESWCNVKIRFTCCMTAILIFRYHIRPPYIHSLHILDLIVAWH